ncbi:fumarylacetoacetate hydrolase family protein [Alphaproteobacteria bacterium]|nr:fumarylacetoacetate hydrolase family protein [Alphaproteobacteria bacterium]
MTAPLTAAEQTSGTWLGRLWNPEVHGPSLVTIRDGALFDITAKAAPTVSAILERDDPADYVRTAPGTALGRLDTLAANTVGGLSQPHMLAPCDLQVIKAAGVTFARSMVERVIEERAAGDLKAADAIRARIGDSIGHSLANIIPGSAQAAALKQTLIREGLWSQYLEVGIGPDAEVFTKAPVLAAVGHGADVGLHPVSTWNNPEPEVVVAVNAQGKVQGACLGNDVNLRDVEGRSALLLSKAKDNNASAAIGPFIRLFDDDFCLSDVEQIEVSMKVTGEDGFVMSGQSNLSEISRPVREIVRQTIGSHHQYPDGFMLYTGTMFAPTKDRDTPGEGFTHKLGDIVEISAPGLGTLTNRVQDATAIAPWDFGLQQFMQNLAQRGLL